MASAAFRGELDFPKVGCMVNSRGGRDLSLRSRLWKIDLRAPWWIFSRYLAHNQHRGRRNSFGRRQLLESQIMDFFVLPACIGNHSTWSRRVVSRFQQSLYGFGVVRAWHIKRIRRTYGFHGFTQRFIAARCAVTTTNAEAARRSVSVIPAAAAAALAAVIPGTISNSIPARRSASSSSPSRPNTAGSPDLSRTIVCASVSRACHTMSALICSWLRLRCPQRLPTLITSAEAGQRSSISCETRSSCSTTSAARSSVAARTVSRSAAPGPPPTM